MDFKEKKQWVLYIINLYIKIALHLKKQTKKSGQWVCLKMVNNMQNAVCLTLVFSYWGPVLTESGTLCIIPSFSRSPSAGLVTNKSDVFWSFYFIFFFHIFGGCMSNELVKGSWIYAQVLGGGRRFTAYFLLATDLICWGFEGVFKDVLFLFRASMLGMEGFVSSPSIPTFPPHISNWPSATSPCCVFLKPMSISHFSTVGF